MSYDSQDSLKKCNDFPYEDFPDGQTRMNVTSGNFVKNVHRLVLFHIPNKPCQYYGYFPLKYIEIKNYVSYGIIISNTLFPKSMRGESGLWIPFPPLMLCSFFCVERCNGILLYQVLPSAALLKNTLQLPQVSAPQWQPDASSAQIRQVLWGGKKNSMGNMWSLPPSNLQEHIKGFQKHHKQTVHNYSTASFNKHMCSYYPLPPSFATTYTLISCFLTF